MLSRPSPQPCMGGWCTARGSCAHYHSTARIEPAERLCAPSDAVHLSWMPFMTRPEHVLEHQTLSLIHGVASERVVQPARLEI